MEFVRAPCSFSPPTLLSVCSLYSLPSSFLSLSSASFSLSFPSSSVHARVNAVNGRSGISSAKSTFCSLHIDVRVTHVCGVLKRRFTLVYPTLCRVCSVRSHCVYGDSKRMDEHLIRGIVKRAIAIIRPRAIVRIIFYVMLRLLLTIELYISFILDEPGTSSVKRGCIV